MGNLTILLVDDSHADAALVQEALKLCTLPVSLHVVPDGLAALAFLHQQAPFAQAPRPDLVLLDLNLPRKDGHGVLAEVRQTPALLGLPIVVFSSSSKAEDIERSYALGANWYMSKPLALEEFFQAVRTIVEQWASFQAGPHESPTLVRDDLPTFPPGNEK
jgi:chemotaxis family two-component system response regulator Rcp1